jgi:hypothetical protein
VTANAKLLRLAKPYPGAKLVRVEVSPYGAPDSDYGPIVGYTTVAYYSLATRPVRNGSIVAFYARELRGWDEKVDTVPCRPVAPPPGAPSGPRSCGSVTTVSFTKGAALIQIQGMARDRSLPASTHYAIAIDSRYGKNAH